MSSLIRFSNVKDLAICQWQLVMNSELIRGTLQWKIPWARGTMIPVESSSNSNEEIHKSVFDWDLPLENAITLASEIRHRNGRIVILCMYCTVLSFIID